MLSVSIFTQLCGELGFAVDVRMYGIQMIFLLKNVTFLPLLYLAPRLAAKAHHTWNYQSELILMGDLCSSFSEPV